MSDFVLSGNRPTQLSSWADVDDGYELGHRITQSVNPCLAHGAKHRILGCARGDERTDDHGCQRCGCGDDGGDDGRVHVWASNEAVEAARNRKNAAIARVRLPFLRPRSSNTARSEMPLFPSSFLDRNVGTFSTASTGSCAAGLDNAQFGTVVVAHPQQQSVGHRSKSASIYLLPGPDV